MKMKVADIQRAQILLKSQHRDMRKSVERLVTSPKRYWWFFIYHKWSSFTSDFTDPPGAPLELAHGSFSFLFHGTTRSAFLTSSLGTIQDRAGTASPHSPSKTAICFRTPHSLPYILSPFPLLSHCQAISSFLALACSAVDYPGILSN